MDAPRIESPSHDETSVWEEVSPVLDAAMASLAATERDAVLLRFMQGKSHQAVGMAMGISEDAARKRVARGIDRLRHFLQARGVTLSVAGLGSLLMTNAVQAAPSTLAATISGSAVAGAAGAGIGAMGIAKGTVATMTWINTKIATLWIVGLLMAGGAGAVAVHQMNANAPINGAPAIPPPAKTLLAMAAPADKPAPAAPAAVTGIIRNADEQPAVGAAVYIAMPRDPAIDRQLREVSARAMAGERIPPNGWPKAPDTIVKVYEEKWPDTAQSADAEGKFTYPNVREPWRLVARTPAGYAEVSSEDFKRNNGQVILQPWGKVEGRLLIGDKPQPGENITLARTGSRDDWVAMNIQHNLPCITDKDGKFVFNAVAPGESWLSWQPKRKQLRIIRHTLVDVEPGKTFTIDIGGKGRPVIGRAAVIPSNAPDERIIWDNARRQSASASYHNVIGTTMPVPPEWPKMTQQQRDAWETDWGKTPAGKEYRSHRWSEEFDINPDGTFRINDLVPGKYGAQFRLFHNENGFGEDLVDCRAEFTVPPLPAGADRTDEPLDLGTIPAKLQPRTTVGKPAPEFEVTTLEGKKIKLSDLKGKYVMLKWWWSWSEVDTEAPAIKKAYDTMMKEDNWLLINLGFDETPAITKKRIADHNIPGLDCQLSDYSNQFPKEYMGSPSTMCIIGPDGKVVARNMHAINADSEVAKIILEKK